MILVCNERIDLLLYFLKIWCLSIDTPLFLFCYNITLVFWCFIFIFSCWGILKFYNGLWWFSVKLHVWLDRTKIWDFKLVMWLMVPVAFMSAALISGTKSQVHKRWEKWLLVLGEGAREELGIVCGCFCCVLTSDEWGHISYWWVLLGGSWGKIVRVCGSWKWRAGMGFMSATHAVSW